MTPTLLITGGNGFLGTHVKQAFKNADSHRILTPRSSELNLLDYHITSSYLRVYKPNTILHMAAICGGIVKNSHVPADFLRDNTQMALNIYEAARQNNITNIYSLGSVCMYPLHCPTPFKEDDIWQGAAEPTNFPYGQAKRTLMMLGQTYRQQYGFTGAHLIPVNMYGIYDSFNDQKSHVIPALIKKFVYAKDNNLPYVECLGSGTATREFLLASDAASAIIKAVSTNFDCELPINLGIGKDISIKELASLIGNLVEYNGEVIFKADGLDGQPKRLLNVERAQQLLNWQATTSLEEGLKQTITWYQANKDAILARG
jgi:GDP-L-fucose synthase